MEGSRMTGDMEWLKGKIRGLLEEGKEVILNTEPFFKKMEKEVGYLEPVLFALVWGLIAGLIHTLYWIIGWSRVGILSFVIVPLCTVIGAFIFAAILHVIAILMGTKRGFEASFRISAYMTVLSPFQALITPLPYVQILLVAFGAYLLAVSFPAVHDVPERISRYLFGVIAVLIILVILITAGGRETLRFEGESDLETLRERMEAMKESVKRLKE